MSWGILGDIEFEVLSHPSAQSERTTADYAEHARIQGKPKLEWIGEGLDELSLEISLHVAVGDPEARVRLLKKAKADHAPLPYVLGSGDFRGIYLITGLDVTTRKTDNVGRLFAALVSLTLREYTGKYTKALPVPLGLRSNLPTNVIGLPVKKVIPGLNTLATTAQKLLSYARTAGSLLRSGLEMYQAAQELVANPMLLLDRVPALMGAARRVLGPLVDFQGSAGLLEGAGDLVRVGIDVAGDVNQAIAALDGVGIDSVVSQFSYSASRMEQALGRMEDAAPRLANLAADVLTRRV
ncbi:phage tail protein [Pseudomonas sichuanensis]|uniref:phage tail protein n=1 Tax=Pseudomonas sichuanensis TaxID=2213015 RepID=UPI00215E8FEA|nr:phage tail protein [Pseudomonas sichuanensis]UVK85238.1 phage tail protein [Pseudomonas sichuanensis]